MSPYREARDASLYACLEISTINCSKKAIKQHCLKKTIDWNIGTKLQNHSHRTIQFLIKYIYIFHINTFTSSTRCTQADDKLEQRTNPLPYYRSRHKRQ